MTTVLPDVPVSVGRTASCPCDFVNIRDPTPYFSFQSVCWLVVAVVWIAHMFVNEMNVFSGRASWEASRLLGVWTLMVLRPVVEPSRIDACCILSTCSSVRRRLRWAKELFRSSALARFTITWCFFWVSSVGTGALAPLRKSHVSLPTSAVIAPDIFGDVALPYLNGCAHRMFLSKKNASLVKVWLTSVVTPFWATTTECTLTLYVLSSKVALSCFCSTPNVNLDFFCVYKKNLSFRLIRDARRSHQHFKVPPKFPMATGDSSSRVQFLVGNPDENALHIASGDVQNAFHYIDILRMASAIFLFETCDDSRFRHDGEDRTGKPCLCGTEVVSCTSDVANEVFLEHVLLSACRAPSGELCRSPSEFTR